ncbi:MAG: GAF domain-containing protein [Gammaproteobacteria bacterium]
MPRSAPAPAESEARALAALAGLGDAISGSRDPARLLATAIEVVCRALEASGGGFMRHEPESDELVLEAPAFGVQAEHVVSRYRVALGSSGNAARVFASREPTIANDTKHDPRFIQRFVRLFDTRNTITVPLVLNDRAIGIFHAINKRDGDFTAADRGLLARLAPCLALCLELVRQGRALASAERRRERARRLHEGLMAAAQRAADVDELCATLHGVLDRPLLLLDALRRPLASHGWPLDPALVAREVARHALRDGRQSEITLRGAQPRRCAALAISLGEERAATLCVLLDAAPGSDDDEQALELAATLVALALQRQRSLNAEAGQAAHALLTALFAEGVGAGEADRLVAELGVVGRGPWRVLLIGLQDAAGVREPLAPGHGAAVKEALERSLGSLRARLRLMPWGGGLVSIAGEEECQRISERGQLRRMQQALDELSRPRAAPRLVLGIGRAEREALALGHSLRAAEQALRALARAAGRNPCLRYEELGVHRLLLGGQRPADHAAFAAEVLAPVLEADGRGQLLDSLVALTAHNFNLAAAARALGVHLNTVKYRLQQLRDAFGGDPSRGDLRLEIELALRIREMR